MIPHRPDSDFRYRSILYGLDEGEIEAVSLARLCREFLLTDEKKAREFAVIYGVKTISTIDIIIEAVKRNIISKQQGIRLLKELPKIMYVSENLVERVIKRLLEKSEGFPHMSHPSIKY